MKLAILGAGGCFGLQTARHFLREGCEVLGIGRSAMRPACFSLEFAHSARQFRYERAHLVLESGRIMGLLEDFQPEVIINYAAQGEGAASFDPQHWHVFYQTNATALAELTGFLMQRDWLRLFIHVGTSELYGSVEAPANEDAPIRPSSPYAASKVAGDLHVLSISRVLGFPGIVVRPSNCYVEGQQLHRVIPRAMLVAATGKKIPLHGGGRAQKSYMHAADLCAALSVLIERGEKGRAYNAGPALPISIRTLLETVADTMRVPFSALVDEAPERTGQDGCYWLDSGALKALGWEPRIGLFEGLNRMRSWIEAWANELAEQPQDYKLRP